MRLTIHQKTKIYCSIIFFISTACSFNEKQKLNTEKKNTETDEEEEEKFDKRENALFFEGVTTK